MEMPEVQLRFDWLGAGAVHILLGLSHVKSRVGLYGLISV